MNKKRIYVAPAVKVVELDCEQALLTSSDGGVELDDVTQEDSDWED